MHVMPAGRPTTDDTFLDLTSLWTVDWPALRFVGDGSTILHTVKRLN